MHWIPTQNTDPDHNWTFNNNLISPTFSPSVRHYYDTYDEVTRTKTGEIITCHYFIVEGKFNYCGDCQHKLNSQQGVSMVSFEHAPDELGIVLVGPEQKRYRI